MKNSIKCIVFDLGGVVFSDGTRIAIPKVEKIIKKYGLNSALLDAMFSGQLAIDLRKGLVSDQNFWAEIEEILGEKYEIQTLKELHFSSYTPQKEAFELLKELKKKYLLAVFSVIYKSRLDWMEEHFPFRKFFDVEAYSFEAKANKREDTFFEYLIKKLPVKPQESILIDDHEYTLEHAKKFGFHPILFKSMEQLKGELKKKGVRWD